MNLNDIFFLLDVDTYRKTVVLKIHELNLMMEIRVQCVYRVGTRIKDVGGGSERRYLLLYNITTILRATSSRSFDGHQGVTSKIILWPIGKMGT